MNLPEINLIFMKGFPVTFMSQTMLTAYILNLIVPSIVQVRLFLNRSLKSVCCLRQEKQNENAETTKVLIFPSQC